MATVIKRPATKPTTTKPASSAASNSASKPASKPAPIKPVAKPARNPAIRPAVKPATPVKRALLIGINYYNTANELSGCINDVLDTQAYLKSTAGFTETVVLKDSPRDPQMKLKDAPTKQNIMAQIASLVAKTKPGDTLYVHFSGHGSQTRDVNKDEPDAKDELICPVNLNQAVIKDDELRAALVEKLVPGAKVRVVFDSCHSGSCLDLVYRLDETLSWQTELKEETKENLAKDVVFISGCRDHQTSADASFQNRANGALTWVFLQCLQDRTKFKQQWTWTQLVTKMRQRIRAKGFDQIPQLDVESQAQASNLVDL